MSIGTPAARMNQGETPVRLHHLALLALAVHLAGCAPTERWRDERRPFAQRVDDLVGRMTLEEKVQQMQDVAPAVPRLGIPEYNWWNEALHGVARAGLATSFPQAIGLAATWDDSLMFDVATAISDEARAKHHDFLRRGMRQRYQGLTFWSPNINLFRDPRWGRGQETYGEDPFLTGRLAIQFIRGMQGDDPKYLKTIATVKHFAVHSGPEQDRHHFDAVVDERDLRESYLPHFEVGIREGGAASLMCAYNRVDGKAACGDDDLLAGILRGEWGFRGYVVSDCGAVDDIWEHHHVAPSAQAAAALAVRTGTDLDCGHTYAALVDAVHQGLISESEIDTSVKRLFLARFELGMFDDPAHVPWAATPVSDLDSPEHRALARRVARESIVLLKNQGELLPLDRNVGTLAVIGPNADQWRMLLGNYNGLPADPVTPLRGIREAVSADTRVLYAQGSDLATDYPVLSTLPASALSTPDGRPGLQADFYADTTFTGSPAWTRTDSILDVDWGYGAPREDLDPERFAVRWTATLHPRRTGNYRLALIGTMKYQLFVDDSLVFRSVYATHNGEFPDPRVTSTDPLRLETGHEYRVRVEAEESMGTADLQLLWAEPIPAETLEEEALKVAREADVVVLCLGLNSWLEREQLTVPVEGFQGGDRTSLDLPAPQERLLELVTGLAKPTVLVLFSGSAMAVGWADRHVPAILEAWYPGQAGGTALADVLFGDADPAGRLPVTFYRSVDDLPPFDDYAMAGRTYRFFRGRPLYPFGYGLSYTRFEYANLRVARDTVGAGDTVAVSVDVTNAGDRAGDEVVQLYARHMGSAVPRPIHDLRGYRRITLAPGETRTVEMRFTVASLAYWDAEAHGWRVEAEPVDLEVGASSSDVRLETRILVPHGGVLPPNGSR